MDSHATRARARPTRQLQLAQRPATDHTTGTVSYSRNSYVPVYFLLSVSLLFDRVSVCVDLVSVCDRVEI